MKNLVTCILAASLFTACTKEKIVEKIVEVPTAKATINIAQPANGDTFHNGDTVRIIATLAGAETLHGYTVTIRNETDHGKEVFFGHWHAHDKNLTVDTIWVSHVSAASDMSLKIDAIIDHDGNSEGKSVGFKSEP